MDTGFDIGCGSQSQMRRNNDWVEASGDSEGVPWVFTGHSDIEKSTECAIQNEPYVAYLYLASRVGRIWEPQRKAKRKRAQLL